MDHVDPSRQAALEAENAALRAQLATLEDRLDRAERLLDSVKLTTKVWDAFFDHAPLAIQIYGRDGASLRMNEANRRLLRLPDVSYGVGVFNALTDPFMVAQGHAVIYARAYAGELVALPDVRVDFGDPTNRWATGSHVTYYSQILVPIHDAEGAVGAVVSCAVDITAWKEAEQAVQRLNADLEALVAERTAALTATVARLEQEVAERRAIEATLRASEERYRALVEASPDLLFRIGRDGTFLDVHAVEEMRLLAQPEQFLGRRISQVMPPQLAALQMAAIVHALATGELQTVQYSLPVGEGERWFEARIVRSGPDEVFASVHDTTARHEAEETRLQVERRLLEAQRLESLGVLAGGIAHDFNNILTAVLGHAELALAEPLSPSTYPHLAAIVEGAGRAAHLTAQILAYAGRGRVQSQPVTLGALLHELSGLATAVAGPLTQVRYRLADGPSPIIGDERQLRQLLLNLITNAAEAAQPSGGVITVEVAPDELSREQLDQLVLGADAPPGPYMRLTVRDTGPGMDAATLARIFDPFFTTKFAGRGLGLAAVHGIVRGHHGAIQVQSAPGEGTAFHVWLPVVRSAAAASPEPPAAPRHQGAGVILVVDDEEGVRQILRRLLERNGYTVLSAADGAAAVALIERGIPGLTGVLLDLTMPGVSSDEVVAALRAVHPAVPLVLMSGYSREELAERQQTLGAAGWLQKPFSGEALRAITAALFGTPDSDG